MIPSDQGCGRCGRSLDQRRLRDVELLVCPACRTVTLDQADFQHLCVATSDLDLPLPEPATPIAPSPPRRVVRWLPLLVGAGLSGIAAIGLVGTVLLLAGRRDAMPSAVVRPRLDERPLLPRVRAEPGEPQTDEPSQAPAVDPSPPAVPSAPAPASPPDLRQRLDRGWSLVERDPDGARQQFEAALTIDPQHADALYGYGYALLALGRPLDARPFLCRALPRADVTTQREIRALNAKHQLTCN